MTSSKILFYFCLAFVAGIFLESLVRISHIFLWIFLCFAVLEIALLLAINIVRKHAIANFMIICGFCILFLTLGILRMQIAEFNIANDSLSKFNGKGEATYTGIISSEPDVRENSQKIKAEINGSTVLITTAKYPEYKYMEKIRVTGKLETPAVTDEFNYKNYLMKDGIYSVMNFPKISVISAASGDELSLPQIIYSGVLNFKQKLRESIRRSFLPPQSYILEGTILGDNGAMSQELKEKLNTTGLRHVISVSGTHVMILSIIIMSLLLSLGLSRGRAFYIAIVFIIIYIVLTGLPASGIRAGVMGGLYLLAQKIGRQSMGVRVIILACAAMLMFNPLLLLYDVGFQLSFLAVLGLLYLDPIIKLFINKFTKGKVKNFASIVSATLAAQIFTMPVMIYNFGNISFVSPITNLLILPVVYWLMIFGFLVSFAGIFSYALAWILSVPCWILLTYFIKIMDFFSQPWAVKTLQNVHWMWLAVAYFLIAFAIRFLNKKTAAFL